MPKRREERRFEAFLQSTKAPPSTSPLEQELCCESSLPFGFSARSASRPAETNGRDGAARAATALRRNRLLPCTGQPRTTFTGRLRFPATVIPLRSFGAIEFS